MCTALPSVQTSTRHAYVASRQPPSVLLPHGRGESYAEPPPKRLGFIFPAMEKSGRNTGVTPRLRHTTLTSPAWLGDRAALLPFVRPKTTAAALVLMYSPRPALGSVGTTLAPRNECRVEARWSSCRLTAGRNVEAPQRTRLREIGKSENVPPLSAAVCTGGDP